MKTSDAINKKVHELPEPLISGTARALVCLNDGPSLVLVTLHARHDEAYRGNR